MNKLSNPLFTTRLTITLDMPVEKHTRILHPDQVIIKTSDRYHDIGALCYAFRSDKVRKARQPREVVIDSLLKQRPKQILQLIKVLSSLLSDRSKSIYTVSGYAEHFNRFMDWADANELHDCLAGGEATRNAFHAWATDTHERYRRQQFGEGPHNLRLTLVCELLEATTGLENLMKGIRKVKERANPNGATQPLALHDFVHAIALNQCFFDGLCNLVLERRPFPYKLDLPASLGWVENHLWLFPTLKWRLPPHQREATIRAKKGTRASWIYDYENGRVSTVEEIECHYTWHSQWQRRSSTIASIRKATVQIDEANSDPHNRWRLVLGMVAQRAFMFLFFCNTGGNVQVVRDLETNGKIDAAAQNQRFRALKWRANGKEVELVVPVTFMPRLRRFMELRKYLLQGRKIPYLFFGCGIHNNRPPAKTSESNFDSHYRNLLIEIDPHLPRMSARALRASVDDYYLRLHDSVVAAAVMGHTVETEHRKYGRGSATDHQEEMGRFMESVSESARHQRVILLSDITSDSSPIEEGGRCIAFGHPEAMAANPPVQPNCKDSQGCLFCNQRVLIAEEEDARKVASAAYVMEQLILGPKHEEALRSSIAKCDEDLEKIAAFPGCRAMVEKVRKDVYENENLTLFWADKYQLFLELGILL
jgi:hypothetical protein